MPRVDAFGGLHVTRTYLSRLSRVVEVRCWRNLLQKIQLNFLSAMSTFFGA